MATLYAGTSGFAYASWKPDFYPQKLPAKKFLKHYATRLNAVEINYTFRQLPKASTLEKWVSATPAGFRFACKAHMRITHIMRLKESEFNEVFFRAIDPLRATAGWGRCCSSCRRILKWTCRCSPAFSKSFRATSAAPSSSAMPAG